VAGQLLSNRKPARRGSIARTGDRECRGCERAWTIIELVIALAVLGLLASIAMPLFDSYRERARVSRAVQDIRIIEAALDRYIAEYQRVPNAIDRIVDPAPVDPWGQPYRYLKLRDAPPSATGDARKDKNLVPINSDYDLYSIGRDGKTQAPLSAPVSADDVLRANDGGYVGLAHGY
jgi:general secretion pathway protein G